MAQLVKRFEGSVPVILTSGRASRRRSTALAGRLLGADDYVVKPVDSRRARSRGSAGRLKSPGGSWRSAGTPAKGALSPQGARGAAAAWRPGSTQGADRRAAGDQPEARWRTHIEHVLVKLGVHSRAQAVAEAYRSHLVSAEFEGHILATDARVDDEPEAESLPPPALVT